MANLPDSVKIGPVAYTVKEVDDLHDVNDEGRKRWLHGQILWTSAAIQIERDQADDVKVTTLVHEALHGILNTAGQNDHPEEMIIALGYGIVQLLRDNPALVKAIVGEKYISIE